MKIMQVAAIGLMLTGCATGEQAQQLELGMTPQQVIDVMGKPDGQSQQGNQLGYQYTNRLISGWSWDRADYAALFEDGVLTSFGPGQVRQGTGPSVGTLIVLP